MQPRGNGSGTRVVEGRVQELRLHAKAAQDLIVQAENRGIMNRNNTHTIQQHNYSGNQGGNQYAFVQDHTAPVCNAMKERDQSTGYAEIAHIPCDIEGHSCHNSLMHDIGDSHKRRTGVI